MYDIRNFTWSESYNNLSCNENAWKLRYVTHRLEVQMAWWEVSFFERHLCFKWKRVCIFCTQVGWLQNYRTLYRRLLPLESWLSSLRIDVKLLGSIHDDQTRDDAPTGNLISQIWCPRQLKLSFWNQSERFLSVSLFFSIFLWSCHSPHDENMGMENIHFEQQ